MRDRGSRWGGRGNGDEGDFGRDFDTIKDDVAKLKADLARAMRNLVSTGKGEVTGARGKLEEAIQEKLDRLNSVTENLSSWGHGAARRVRSRAEKNPAEVALIVLGAGVLLGALVLGSRPRRW
jgi:ElaB/YqjD/DUF883 family membrane-anchored ribosome-binding protein